MKTSNPGNLINALPKGGSIEISKCNGIRCTAERSGKGDILRFVRHFPNGSLTVFKTCKF